MTICFPPSSADSICTHFGTMTELQLDKSNQLQQCCHGFSLIFGVPNNSGDKGYLECLQMNKMQVSIETEISPICLHTVTRQIGVAFSGAERRWIHTDSSTLSHLLINSKKGNLKHTVQG